MSYTLMIQKYSIIKYLMVIWRFKKLTLSHFLSIVIELSNIIEL